MFLKKTLELNIMLRYNVICSLKIAHELIYITSNMRSSQEIFFVILNANTLKN